MNNILSHIPEINFAEKANYLVNATSEFLARTDAQTVLETSKVAIGIFLAVAALAITVRYCYNRFHKAAAVTPPTVPNAPYVSESARAAERIKAKRLAEVAKKNPSTPSPVAASSTTKTPEQLEAEKKAQIESAVKNADAVRTKTKSYAQTLPKAAPKIKTVQPKKPVDPAIQAQRDARRNEKIQAAQAQREKEEAAKNRGPTPVDVEFDPANPFPNARPRSPATV